MSGKVNKNVSEYRDDDEEEEDQQPISDISVSDLSDDYELPGGRHKSKLGRPTKKIKLNRYIEEEAEEASEDERDLQDAKKRPEDKEYEDKFNQMLQRRPNRDVIKTIEERYKDGEEGGELNLYDTDSSNEVEPPKLSDPKVWRVNCTRGKENESAMSVMFKYANHKVYDQPLEVVSAFALKAYPGVVFVEANFDWQVLSAIDGLYHLRYHRVELVEPQQCVHLFTPIEVESIPIKSGQWVRIRRHQIYEGDLGRVLLVDELKRSLLVKLIGREKRQISSYASNSVGGGAMDEEVAAVSGSLKLEHYTQDERPSRWSQRTKVMLEGKRFVRGPKIAIKYDRGAFSQDQSEDYSVFYYASMAVERDRCKKDGFALLNTLVGNVVWRNIKPTLDELAYFYPDLKNIRCIIPRLQRSLQAAVGSQSTFQVGDKVCLDKEHPGIRFTVKDSLADGRLLLTHSSKDKSTQEIKVYEHLAEVSTVKQVFVKYQQVTVMSGPNVGLQGVIIEVRKNTAVLSTEQGKAIECLLADLQSSIKIQGYDVTTNPYRAPVSVPDVPVGVTRNDLVKFGVVEQDIGCVLSQHKDDMTILNLSNQLKHVNLKTVTGRLNTRFNVAKNMHRQEIRKGDLIVILDGFYKGCKATAIHVYRDVVYLHSGKFDHTQGVTVEAVNNCVLISAGNRALPRPPKNLDAPVVEDLVGQQLTIARGRWSGYRGMVVSVQARTVAVQLTAKHLTVKVLKEELHTTSHTTQQRGAGMTPHYLSSETTNQKSSQGGGYQSPFVYEQSDQQ